MKEKGQKLKICAKKARAANKRRVAFLAKIATRWIYFIHIFKQLLVPNLSKLELITLTTLILSNIFAKLNGQSQTFEVKSVPPLYVLFAPWSKLHIFNFSKICTSITMPLSSRNTRSRPESNPKRFLQHVIDIINRNLLQFVSRDPE